MKQQSVGEEVRNERVLLGANLKTWKQTKTIP